MTNEHEKRLNELQTALIKQKNYAIPEPPEKEGLDQLFNQAQNFHQEVTRVVISVLNGELQSDMVPDGDDLQRKIEGIQTTNKDQGYFISRLLKWKKSQDDLMELALGLYEDQGFGSEPYREVYQAQGQLDANIMLAYLIANGVDAFSSQESAGVTFGLTIGPLGVARIYVPKEQFVEAIELIQKMDNYQSDSDVDQGDDFTTDDG